MDFVRRWSEKTEIGCGRFIGCFGITASKFYDWPERYGKVDSTTAGFHSVSCVFEKAGVESSRFKAA